MEQTAQSPAFRGKARVAPNVRFRGPYFRRRGHAGAARPALRVRRRAGDPAQASGQGLRLFGCEGQAGRESRHARSAYASLVIPPAWTDVWICASADGHIQATGRDAKGRKQYKYHAEYREAREQSKYEHLLEFAAALPTIRAKVAEHMSLRGLPREKVLATVVHLLETTLIRVGNDEYARTNQSYGLTTLRSEHVAVEGAEVRFHFTGKSGKQWSLAMRDRRVARIIRACQELPGQDLLQYFDEDKDAARGVVRRRQRLSQRDRRRRRHRQGFPHLGRNGADGAVSLKLASVHERDAGQARDERRGQAGRGGVGQHRRRVPQVLYPSGDRRGLSRRRLRADRRAGERGVRIGGSDRRGDGGPRAARGFSNSALRALSRAPSR